MPTPNTLVYKTMTVSGPIYECPETHRQFFAQEQSLDFGATDNPTPCSKCGKVIDCQNKAQMQDGLYCTEFAEIDALDATDCKRCLRMPICAIRSSEYEPDCCDSFKPITEE